MLSLCFCLPFVGRAQGNVERLDLRPGFREFKFKTLSEDYIATFSLQRTNQYHWPDIVQVYTCRYKTKIGNTETDSVHVFFLGNRLVRTLVFLKEPLSVQYIHKFFGESMPKGTYVEHPLGGTHGRRFFDYQYKERWEADMVRMETLQVRPTVLRGEPKAWVSAMDFCLIDFSDMMDVLNR